MAHKTLIGGTAYEISGGKPLVDGTAYSIKNGKTLVGGTAYEVGFAEMVTVCIEAHSNSVADVHDSELCRVTINGIEYDGSEKYEISIPVGTVAKCYTLNNKATVNGTTVATGPTYNHTITTNTTFGIGVYEHPVTRIGYIEIHEW